jgi:hypothetical protein
MESQIINRLLFIIILQITIFGQSMSYKFLVLHPIYSGSHVLTVHQISRELVKRGHDVLTIRYKDTHNLKLEKFNQWEGSDENGRGDAENRELVKYSVGSFREYQLSLNNSEGNIPYVTDEEDAKFVIPSDLLWGEGNALSCLFKLPRNPWDVLKGNN